MQRGPLVGREKELAVVDSLRDVSGVRVLLVSGDPGSGKTRFLAEVAASLHDRAVIPIRGYEPESAVPFAAAGELIRSAAATGEPAVPTDMLHVFETAARMVHESAPLALLVDDDQWLDDATRALLHYVVRAAHERCDDVLLTFAGRPHSAAGRVHDSITAILGPDLCRRIELGPLSRESGVQLATAIAPHLTGDDAARLWSLTGGSPLWISMVAAGGDRSVSDVVRGRLRSAPTDAAEMMAVLAVAARPVPLSALVTMLGWDTGRATASASALVDRGLLVLGAGTATVVHDLVRETVVASLDEDHRDRLHLLVADWLSTSDDPGGLLAAVQHRSAAGRDSTDLVGQVLRSPRRAWIGPDGVALLEREMTAAPPDDGALLAALATLAAEVAQPDQALRLWERAAHEATTAEARAVAFRSAAAVALDLGDNEACHRWLTRAREAGGDDPVAAVELDVLESQQKRWLESDFAGAAGLAERAVERARGLAAEDAPGAARALVGALAVVYEDAMVRGDLEAVPAIALEMDDAAVGDADLAHTAVVYRLQTFALHSGDVVEHEQLARREFDRAERARQPARTVEVGIYLLDALALGGRLEEAQQVASRLRDLVSRTEGLPRKYVMGLDDSVVESALHEVAALCADWRAEVRSLLQTVEQLGAHMSVSRSLPPADLTARLGDPKDMEAALEIVDRAHERSLDVGCPRCSQNARLAAARTHALAGHLDRAGELLCGWDQGTNPSPLVRRSYLWASGLLQLGCGDRERADRQLDDVERELTEEHNQLEQAWLLLDRAAMLAATDPGSAVELLDRARLLGRRMGASNVESSAAARMRRLGARPWRRGPSSGTGLTDRERDVARLLADGATNPEIADRLFVSRKTVERQVSQILAKLGVRNRVEAAAVLREHLHDEGPAR